MILFLEINSFFLRILQFIFALLCFATRWYQGPPLLNALPLNATFMSLTNDNIYGSPVNVCLIVSVGLSDFPFCNSAPHEAAACGAYVFPPRQNLCVAFVRLGVYRCSFLASGHPMSRQSAD